MDDSTKLNQCHGRSSGSGGDGRDADLENYLTTSDPLTISRDFYTGRGNAAIEEASAAWKTFLDNGWVNNHIYRRIISNLPRQCSGETATKFTEALHEYKTWKGKMATAIDETIGCFSEMQRNHQAVRDAMVPPQTIESNRQEADRLRKENTLGVTHNERIAELDTEYERQRIRNIKTMRKYRLLTHAVESDLPVFREPDVRMRIIRQRPTKGAHTSI